MNVMAIGAHPDDIEIFMFGLLKNFQKRGDKVNLVIATDGSLGGTINHKDLKMIRSIETKKALKSINKPHFLEISDGTLGFNNDHFFKIKSKIEEINPDLIITHHKNDYHSDHRNLSKIVCQVISHYTPILFCDTMMGVNFSPLYYVDITSFIKEKRRSILYHKSQKPKRFVNLVNLMNSYRAAQCNAPEGSFAEAYSFKRSFPFSDISKILPKTISLRPFHSNEKVGFL